MRCTVTASPISRLRRPHGIGTASIQPKKSEGRTAMLALYASVGNELTHYDVDVPGAALTRRASVGLRANVQYVWPHASQPFLYAATSDSASGIGAAGANQHVSALKVDTGTGALALHGAPI